MSVCVCERRGYDRYLGTKLTQKGSTPTHKFQLLYSRRAGGGEQIQIFQISAVQRQCSPLAGKLGEVASHPESSSRCQCTYTCTLFLHSLPRWNGSPRGRPLPSEVPLQGIDQHSSALCQTCLSSCLCASSKSHEGQQRRRVRHCREQNLHHAVQGAPFVCVYVCALM